MSPPKLILPRGLPSREITLHHRYDAPSDFLTALSMSSLLHLFIDTSSPWKSGKDIPRSPLTALVACRALRPRGCHPWLSTHATGDVAFWLTETIGHPKIINGAQSLQPVGLRPASFLSTLNFFRYRYSYKQEAQDSILSGAGPPLLRRHFQPLAVRRLVAHQPFTNVQARKFARHSGCSYRSVIHRAAVASTSEHCTVRYLPVPRIY